MRILVLIVALLISSPISSQEILETPIKEKGTFFKNLYQDFLKYGRIFLDATIHRKIGNLLAYFRDLL